VCAPALTAVTAFAYMVGIGGASYMSISLGQKEHHLAKDILGNAFFLLMGIAVFVAMGGNICKLKKSLHFKTSCDILLHDKG